MYNHKKVKMQRLTKMCNKKTIKKTAGGGLLKFFTSRMFIFLLLLFINISVNDINQYAGYIIGSISIMIYFYFFVMEENSLPYRIIGSIIIGIGMLIVIYIRNEVYILLFCIIISLCGLFIPDKKK